MQGLLAQEGTKQKSPEIPGFFYANDRSGHRLDGCGQAAFMASRLILVNDSLVCYRIYCACGCFECSLRNRFIGRCDTFSRMLDRRTQLGAKAHVAVMLADILSRAFPGLCTVSH
jgi:hypothetical protein